MGADFLAEHGRAEYPNNRHLCSLQGRGRLNIGAKWRVMAAGQCLIMIDTVQAHAKQDHNSLFLEPWDCIRDKLWWQKTEASSRWHKYVEGRVCVASLVGFFIA